MSRVAIVHDYFVQTGGAERVAEALYSIYPDATVFATVALADHMPSQLEAADVRTTWMQRLPRMSRYYRHYFLLYPWAVESLDLNGYELILSSSSGYAKGLKRPDGSVHVCYCHTPMRWAWRSEEYTRRERHGRISRILIGASLGSLRRWDLRASKRPDYYIANSRAVADRIQKTYKPPRRSNSASYRRESIPALEGRARRLLSRALAPHCLQAHRPCCPSVYSPQPPPGRDWRRPGVQAP